MYLACCGVTLFPLAVTTKPFLIHRVFIRFIFEIKQRMEIGDSFITLGSLPSNPLDLDLPCVLDEISFNSVLDLKTAISNLENEER